MSRRACIGFASLVLLCSIPLVSQNNLKADRIVVLKTERKMILYRQGKELKSYKIALGPNSVGAKTRRGDHRTPEGIYCIDAKNAKSRYHLALHVSYPNQQGRARA